MTGNKQISSKLPMNKASIFSVMGQMARDYGAVNLSQGFPNFDTDKKLKELVNEAMKNGYNQYAPLAGIAPLREQIIEKIYSLHGRRYDMNKEITVTNGATQALFLAITAFVHPGDEVIVLKPAYDSYEPAIELNGGVPVPVQMKGKDFEVDWGEVKEKITARTRMIIINTPHNPSGRVFTENDMKWLQEILDGSNIILLSDEVYEHIVFDDYKHLSASSFEKLAERSIVCASFGKTFHNTGWKMGYCVGPLELMKEIHKVQEVNVFCVNHPMQRAFAEYLKTPSHYTGLGKFYQEKRDKFLSLVKETRFQAKASQGTYFQLLDYSEITDENDVDFSKRLVKDHNLASIPVSVFSMPGVDHRQLRFCFAKTDETLEKAAEILRKISP